MATDALPRHPFRLRPGRQRDWVLYVSVVLMLLWLGVVAFVLAEFGRFGEALEQDKKMEGAALDETRPPK